MNLRSLIVTLLVALTVAGAGCATKERPPELKPQVLISENTWRRVDQDIVAASKDATDQAKIYTRGSMDHWRLRVYQRTEEDFIPWFSNYWTQEWLSMKVTWYTISAGKDEKDRSTKRLAAYLQEQYHDRVLAPVAVEIDPDAIMGQATEFYVQLLSTQLQAIARRYGVPVQQLNRRLNDIPAITLAPPPANNASLYQVLHTEPIATLPAYMALTDQIHAVAAKTGANTSDTAISTVAKRTSEKFEAQFASRGIASAAAAAAGRVAGMMISMGAAGIRAMAHESDRPEMEAQVRQNLGTAFDQAWLKLVKSPTTGVMASVLYLAGQIEGSLTKAIEMPVRFGPVPREIPLPGQEAVQEQRTDEQVPVDDGSTGEQPDLSADSVDHAAGE
ncbi:hypothetical protein [Pseudomonas fluorescens]|uniref:Lipoprotein n=1 Tax=Pseudomonas fluorescens TaxID=294 RepID=A0A5E7BWN2_PSEFL|nr:hypothetical protein [Pseudomonas fluorescens]VVN96862.1 hypothetical protein PS723_02320 [Pseudomonas fluorescens]